MKALLLYIGDDLDADMARFNEQLELPVHEVALTQAQLEGLRAACQEDGQSLDDLGEVPLSEWIADYFGCLSGRREGAAFYATTEENADGRWDYYGAGPPLLKLKVPRKRLFGLLKENAVHSATVDELDPEAFRELQTGAVLRDGEWHEPVSTTFDPEAGVFWPDASWAAEYANLTADLAPTDSVTLVSYHY